MELCSTGLSTFPQTLLALTSITSLTIRWNCLSCIPSAIATLSRLTHLDLSFNYIDTVDSAIALLPLERLLLSDNRIAELPEEICSIASLVEFNLKYNRLVRLPSAMSHMTCPHLLSTLISKEILFRSTSWVTRSRGTDPSLASSHKQPHPAGVPCRGSGAAGGACGNGRFTAAKFANLRPSSKSAQPAEGPVG